MTIKHTHQEVPKNHKFPDGSRINYYRSNANGLVYGQLINARGKRAYRPFRYLGDTK